jgi:GTP-binding protein EngB required for normal cell division
MTWRDFNAPDLDDLSRVVALIDSGETHTDYDRHIISRLAEKGLTIVHLG